MTSTPATTWLLASLRPSVAAWREKIPDGTIAVFIPPHGEGETFACDESALDTDLAQALDEMGGEGWTRRHGSAIESMRSLLVRARQTKPRRYVAIHLRRRADGIARLSAWDLNFDDDTVESLADITIVPPATVRPS